MNARTALVVDDEADICELLTLTLGRMQITARSATTLRAARELLETHIFDLCLTDMRLPDGNGLELVEYIQTHQPQLPVAVITAYGNVETAVQALKAGAFDFISKPVDLQILRNLVSTVLKLGASFPGHDRRSRHSLLGESPAIQATRATIVKLARSQAPIYISGESGSGKELVARLIHEKGPRADAPFLPVNCGAIPTELMESEFFGHKKGSFSGAVADKEGLFQAAQGGTLFLDEIGELPLHMQVKLLRAIQEKAVRPIGLQKETPIDVRILSATHKDLGALVKQGQFRQDLYYRINVIELHVPSLRERSEDIPLLSAHILDKLAIETGVKPPRLDAQALTALSAYGFPGNVRELENILERAMTLCEGNTIRTHDLQLPDADAGEASHDEEGGALDAVLGSVEKEAILRALEQTRYNKTAAAKVLGITFRALRYRLKKLGLE